MSEAKRPIRLRLGNGNGKDVSDDLLLAKKQRLSAMVGYPL